METSRLRQILAGKAQGLEAIITLSNRADFPPSTQRECIEEYMDSLRVQDPAAYGDVRYSIQKYAQALREEQESIKKGLEIIGGPRLKFAAGIAMLPTYLALNVGRWTAIVTNSSEFYTYGALAAVTTEMSLAFYILQNHDSTIGKILSSWILGSAMAYSLVGLYYGWRRQRTICGDSHLIKYYNSIEQSKPVHREIANKLEEYFDFKTEA